VKHCTQLNLQQYYAVDTSYYWMRYIMTRNIAQYFQSRLCYLIIYWHWLQSLKTWNTCSYYHITIFMNIS